MYDNIRLPPSRPSPKLFRFQFLVIYFIISKKRYKKLGAKKLGNLHKGKTFSHASCICFSIFLEFFGLIDMHNHQLAQRPKNAKKVQKKKEFDSTKLITQLGNKYSPKNVVSIFSKQITLHFIK